MKHTTTQTQIPPNITLTAAMLSDLFFNANNSSLEQMYRTHSRHDSKPSQFDIRSALTEDAIAFALLLNTDDKSLIDWLAQDYMNRM